MNNDRIAAASEADAGRFCGGPMLRLLGPEGARRGAMFVEELRRMEEICRDCKLPV